MSETELDLNITRGNINEKVYNNGILYRIINYDKNYLAYDDAEAFNYRSVIVSHPENKIVCFSPPRSVCYSDFIFCNPCLDDSIYINEYLEGTMINLFYDERLESWELSTKSGIGANYFYYKKTNKKHDQTSKVPKQKTFYQMFLEAFRMNEYDTLADIYLLKELSKTHCYSFVLQHPDNHIVLDIQFPKLYLVSVYEIVNNNTIRFVPLVRIQEWKCFSNGIIEFPKRIESNSYDGLYDSITSMYNNPDMLGVIITNLVTGTRTKIENPVYHEKKVLRGNNPNLQYQYLCLSRIKKVDGFLECFPKYKKMFKNFSYDYSQLIRNVHSSYLQYYVENKKSLVSNHYLPHIRIIHKKIYLPSLNSETPIIIKKNIVRRYFDNMHPHEILYHLNYNVRCC